MPFGHFILLPMIFLLSGCFGLGERDRNGYRPPKIPEAAQAIGTISLSGSGAGSTLSTGGQTASGSSAQSTGLDGQVSIGPQLEALTTEIRSLRGRFEAMEPAINRLVRVEQDMTVLIAEMELLANEPVPFVSPENLFTPAKEVPIAASVAPLTSQPVAQSGAAAKLAKSPQVTPDAQQGGQSMPTLSLGLTPGLPSSDQNAARTGLIIPQPQAAESPQAPIKGPLRLGRQATPAIALAPAFEPALAPAPTLAPAGQPFPFAPPANNAPAVATVPNVPIERIAALPPNLTCDAFGVHVGSYLLDESIAAAREVVWERHASVLEGLYFTTAEIDLRDGRGVFHRLIAGPIGGYEQAIRMCNAIESRGDYCKVTFFDPPDCPSAFN